MSDNKKPEINEALGLMVLAAAIAVLTYPLLVYSGVNDLLTNLSVYCAKGIFQLFGINP